MLILLTLLFSPLVTAAPTWTITPLSASSAPLSLLQLTPTTLLLLTSTHLHRLFTNGTLIWSVPVPSQATPFDLCHNPTLGVFYLLTATTATPTRANLIQYPLNPPLTPVTLYTTPNTTSNVKLFSCTIYQHQIYLTGGTSSSLFSPAFGLVDIIILRLSSEGTLVHASQFGSPNSELARAITVTHNHIAIAVQRDISTGIQSVLYLIHPHTLQPLTEHIVPSFGSTPLFIPIQISSATTNNVTTFAVLGTALVVPDRHNDIFLHLYAGESRQVALYRDGNRRPDFGVGVKPGTDGNFYAIGGGERGVLLTVVSPAGKNLVEEWYSVESDVRVLGKGDDLFFAGQQWLGHVHVDQVERFEGFGSVVDPANTDSPDHKTSPDQSGAGAGLLTIIGAAVGGAAGMLILAFIVMIVKRRREQPRDSPALTALFTSPRARLL